MMIEPTRVQEEKSEELAGRFERVGVSQPHGRTGAVRVVGFERGVPVAHFAISREGARRRTR